MDILLPSMHMTLAKAMVQSLLMYFFILYNSNKGKHWNPLESVGIPQNMGIPMDSNRFQQIPMETIPGGSRIPNDSSEFHRIPLEIPWNGSNMPGAGKVIDSHWIPVDSNTGSNGCH